MRAQVQDFFFFFGSPFPPSHKSIFLDKLIVSYVTSDQMCIIPIFDMPRERHSFLIFFFVQEKTLRAQTGVTKNSDISIVRLQTIKKTPRSNLFP